ncbi:prolyl 4-hydroxylase subunit alpha-1 isoform X1 [Drosophila gunungcola]|uniref:prolyl 4-hydroxylase subunit alpha-1 isoform X1 n=1 Tax=Drosophila gunungcola TaxID=103775 RepID=UPI0022E15615|nr:prolyl 4-hydroxylase subunit alpha-1 isoform X1 [Drosophila gunungcola]
MHNILVFIFLLILVEQNLSTSSEKDENLVSFHNKDYYSSSVLGLVNLLKLEQEFMENFTIYANVLQDKVDNLNIYLDNLKRPNHTTHKEREKFVSNPLNAFGLIRRLNQDWPKLQNYTREPLGLLQLNAMEEILNKAPVSFDMNETLKAMHRIETTYDLQAKDIAKGLLQSKQFNYKLNVRDCLALAHHNFDVGDFSRSLLWFGEASDINTEPSQDIFSKLLSLELKAFATSIIKRSSFMSNQTTIHKSINNQLQDAKTKDLEHIVKSKLSQWATESMNASGNSRTAPNAMNIGCQGLFPKRTNLVCRYNFTTNSFLKLAPLKVEEISRDPYIIMIHGAISVKEIEKMRGNLEYIKQMGNGWTETDDSKEIVARIHWIREQSPFIDRINQRIADITGFKLEEFPALQLANFGVGGYFRAHHDYYTERLKEVDANNTLGDRIASLIFYAGDVSQGGQTVFPDIKVAVEPQKGNALFWLNDFDDSSPDPRSLHSVCPVIVGSRWTITKWIHHDPQVFVKPCSPRFQKKGLKK